MESGAGVSKVMVYVMMIMIFVIELRKWSGNGGVAPWGASLSPPPHSRQILQENCQLLSSTRSFFGKYQVLKQLPSGFSNSIICIGSLYAKLAVFGFRDVIVRDLEVVECCGKCQYLLARFYFSKS